MSERAEGPIVRLHLAHGARGWRGLVGREVVPEVGHQRLFVVGAVLVLVAGASPPSPPPPLRRRGRGIPLRLPLNASRSPLKMHAGDRWRSVDRPMQSVDLRPVESRNQSHPGINGMFRRRGPIASPYPRNVPFWSRGVQPRAPDEGPASDPARLATRRNGQKRVRRNARKPLRRTVAVSFDIYRAHRSTLHHIFPP